MTKTTQTTQPDFEWVIMAKALRGELSEQEQQEFTNWLNADEAHAQLWADATVTWQEVGSIHDQTFTPNTQKAWDTISSSIQLKPLPEALEPAHAQTIVRPLYPSWKKALQYAAVLLILAGISWVAFLKLNPANDWTQVATLPGERKLIYLPDSSSVILNQGSTLKYQTAFKGAERKVDLTGEAFFDVKKNSAKPFVITSQDAVTKVLGTSFNVKAPKESNAVKVTVETGKVSLATIKHKKEIILLPGFTGTLDASGQLSKTETDIPNQPSWRTITFKNASLKEVSAELASYFGVSVSLKSTALQNCSFTGTFEKPDLQQIMAVLAASSDITIKQTNTTTYLISGPGCR